MERISPSVSAAPGESLRLRGGLGHTCALWLSAQNVPLAGRFHTNSDAGLSSQQRGARDSGWPDARGDGHERRVPGSVERAGTRVSAGAGLPHRQSPRAERPEACAGLRSGACRAPLERLGRRSMQALPGAWVSGPAQRGPRPKQETQSPQLRRLQAPDQGAGGAQVQGLPSRPVDGLLLTVPAGQRQLWSGPRPVRTLNSPREPRRQDPI